MCVIRTFHSARDVAEMLAAGQSPDRQTSGLADCNAAKKLESLGLHPGQNWVAALVPFRKPNRSMHFRVSSALFLSGSELCRI
jgi:hypothetical protein